MNFSRLLSFGFATLALLLPVAIYVMYIQYLGFPDGHLTELERAERLLYWPFTAVSIILGIFLHYSYWKTYINKTGRKLTIPVLLYFLLLIVFGLIEYYFRLHLEHGTGG